MSEVREQERGQAEGEAPSVERLWDSIPVRWSASAGVLLAVGFIAALAGASWPQLQNLDLARGAARALADHPRRSLRCTRRALKHLVSQSAQALRPSFVLQGALGRPHFGAHRLSLGDSSLTHSPRKLIL